MLLERLPRHRDRVTFDVLAGPRVYNSAKRRAVPLGGIRPVRIVLLVVALPGVTHGVVGASFGELLDLLISEIRVEIEVSLNAKTINDDAFVRLVGDVFINKGLAGFHGRHLAGIQDCAKITRIAEVPIGECAVLRVIKGDAQTPQGFRGAGRTRLQGVPAETSLAVVRGVELFDNTRTGREVRGHLRILLDRARLVADAAGEFSRDCRLNRGEVRDGNKRAARQSQN